MNSTAEKAIDMILFPPAKINLGLRILRKRSDGYHDLDTCFYLIGLTDVLEILPAAEMSLNVTGIVPPGNPDDNLCVKAWHLLKADFPSLPTVYMHLHKNIPTGAGLGGGSADGAYALRGLNEKFKLGLSREQLIEYAVQLGSDCPFFIHDTPCIGSGRGELLQPIDLSLKSYHILLINPGIHISTKEAFAGTTPIEDRKPIREIIAQPIESWQEELMNDFESSIFPNHPEIARIKQQLIDAGAVYASMSGSGSTVYGIFKGEPGRLKFPEHYFIYRSRM
jgi:4-diphosphocytidyl-2-C-methyl-D-erythritol kinase